jgi:hypothetical protein
MTYSSNISSLKEIDGSNTFTGNLDQFIRVTTNSTITANMTMQNVGIPWYLENGLSINNASTSPKLTIRPGTEIWVGAVGTSTERIKFRGLNDTPGHWGGFDVRTTSPGTKFEYCDISGGGSGTSWPYYSCLAVDNNARVELSNVNISNSLRYGIVHTNTAIITWSNVNFTNISTTDVWNYSTGLPSIIYPPSP